MTPKRLFVDDDDAVRNLIKLHLRTDGYLVYAASDA